MLQLAPEFSLQQVFQKIPKEQLKVPRGYVKRLLSKKKRDPAKATSRYAFLEGCDLSTVCIWFCSRSSLVCLLVNVYLLLLFPKKLSFTWFAGRNAWHANVWFGPGRPWLQRRHNLSEQNRLWASKYTTQFNTTQQEGPENSCATNNALNTFLLSLLQIPAATPPLQWHMNNLRSPPIWQVSPLPCMNTTRCNWMTLITSSGAWWFDHLHRLVWHEEAATPKFIQTQHCRTSRCLFHELWRDSIRYVIQRVFKRRLRSNLYLQDSQIFRLHYKR